MKQRRYRQLFDSDSVSENHGIRRMFMDLVERLLEFKNEGEDAAYGEDDLVGVWNFKKFDFEYMLKTGVTHGSFINRKRAVLYELIHEVITPQSASLGSLLWCRANAALHIEVNPGQVFKSSGLEKVAKGALDPTSGISTAVVTPATGGTGLGLQAATPASVSHGVPREKIEAQTRVLKQKYDDLKQGSATFQFTLEKSFKAMHEALKLRVPAESMRQAGDDVVEGIKEALGDMQSSGTELTNGGVQELHML